MIPSPPVPKRSLRAQFTEWLRGRRSLADDAAMLADLHRVSRARRHFWSELEAGRRIADRMQPRATPTAKRHS